MSSLLENSKACWLNSLHNGTGNFWQITGNSFYGDQEKVEARSQRVSESANPGREVAHREPRGYTSTRARSWSRTNNKGASTNHTSSKAVLLQFPIGRSPQIKRLSRIPTESSALRPPPFPSDNVVVSEPQLSRASGERDRFNSSRLRRLVGKPTGAIDAAAKQSIQTGGDYDLTCAAMRGLCALHEKPAAV